MSKWKFGDESACRLSDYGAGPDSETADTADVRILLGRFAQTGSPALSVVLKRVGFRVLAVDSEAEAIDIVRTLRFDVLLLEATGLNADTLPVVRDIRRLAPRLLLVLLVSGPQQIDMAEVFEAGADDCLWVPYSTRELVARLRALVSRSRIYEDMEYMRA